MSGSRLLYSSYYEYSQYFACWHTVYRYILPTLLAVYSIVRFQDFTLPSISRLPTVRDTAGKQYVTRRVFHSCIQQYFQFHTLDMSPRRSWPSVILLIHFRYSLYFGLQYYCNTLSTRSTKTYCSCRYNERQLIHVTVVRRVRPRAERWCDCEGQRR